MKKTESLSDFQKRATQEERIMKHYQKKVDAANNTILTIIEDATELDIDKIIGRLTSIKSTNNILRNAATLQYQARFMAGRSSGIGTAIDLLNTIKKNNQK